MVLVVIIRYNKLLRRKTMPQTKLSKVGKIVLAEQILKYYNQGCKEDFLGHLTQIAIEEMVKIDATEYQREKLELIHERG